VAGHPLGGEQPPHSLLLIILFFYDFILYLFLNFKEYFIILYWIGHVASWWLLDENEWLGFQKKPMGNS
jgi:hypothetical protein